MPSAPHFSLLLLKALSAAVKSAPKEILEFCPTTYAPSRAVDFFTTTPLASPIRSFPFHTGSRKSIPPFNSALLTIRVPSLSLSPIVKTVLSLAVNVSVFTVPVSFALPLTFKA